MKSKFIVVLRIGLVALFLSYNTSVLFFTHTHHFEGGNVTHSHPYLPNATHTHTTNGIHQIDFLSTFLFIVAGSALLLDNRSFLILLFSEITKKLLQATNFHPSLRAPPTCYLY